MPDEIDLFAENNVAFGQLIEHWSTNPEQIPEASDQDAIRQALLAASLKIPDRIKTITIISEKMDTLHVVVPPREMYLRGHAAAAALGSAPYALHPEYAKQVTDATNHLAATDFYYFRVGEYTVNQCK